MFGDFRFGVVIRWRVISNAEQVRANPKDIA